MTPANPTVAKGLTEQFTATGTYTDGSTAEPHSQVTWASATTSVATINTPAAGLATDAGHGHDRDHRHPGRRHQPERHADGHRRRVDVDRGGAGEPVRAKGLTEQFTATGTYTDGSTADLTTQVTWASGTTSVATISTRRQPGLAHAWPPARPQSPPPSAGSPARATP